MKRYAPIQILNILILAILTAGLGLYLAPRIGEVLSLKVVDWSILPAQEIKSDSPFIEQSLLEQKYESALAADITETLEKITGENTVHAVVRAPLDFVQETTYPARKAEMSTLATEVRRLSVTVLLDDDKIPNKKAKAAYQPRSQKDLKKYTQIVKSLVGFDAYRGDKVEVQNVPFAPEAGKVFGISRPVWANGIAFILFASLILGIIFGFLFPLMRLMVKGVAGGLSGHRYPLIKKVIMLCERYPEQSLAVIRGWLNAPPIRKNNRCYALFERAGILALTLGPVLSRKILKNLPEIEGQKLAKIISNLGRIEETDIQETLARFLRDFYAPSYLQGSPQKAQELFPFKGAPANWTDVCNLPDEKIRTLLKHIHRDIMTMALSGEDTNTQRIFARNMPPAVWEDLKARLENANINASRARQIIIQTAKELHLFG